LPLSGANPVPVPGLNHPAEGILMVVADFRIPVIDEEISLFAHSNSEVYVFSPGVGEGFIKSTHLFQDGFSE
jgi:hypothetical protein